MSLDLTVFHPFPRLAKETRLQIWQLAITEPRVVDVRYHLPAGRESGYFVSPNQVPTTLHACFESRAAVSTYYTPAFINEDNHCRRYIWVNFNIDTIGMLDHELPFLDGLNDDTASIRWMEIQAPEKIKFMYYQKWMNGMPGLRGLDILSSTPVWTWGSQCLLNMEKGFMDSFDGIGNWKLPKIRLIEKSTGYTVDSDSLLQLLRGRKR